MNSKTWLAAGALILTLQIPAKTADNQGGDSEQTKALTSAPAGFDVKRDDIERGKMETIDYESKVSGGMRKMVV